MNLANSIIKNKTPRPLDENPKSKRILWVDTVRGFAILLVILGHTPIPSKLLSYIYSFHVPLFFILSGFLVSHSLAKPFPDFLKAKFLRLVIPYLFLALVNYIFWLATAHLPINSGLFGLSPVMPLNGIIVAIRDSGFMATDGALWFICALFLAELSFYGIHKIAKGRTWHIIIYLFGLTIFGCIYNIFIRQPLPWSVDTLPFVLCFIGAGFFMKNLYAKYTESTLRFKLWLFTSALAISVITWYLNRPSLGRVDMFASTYGAYILYFIAAISGSLAVIIFFERIKYTPKALVYMGKNSLLIYGFHQKIIFGIIGLFFLSTLHTTFPFAGYTTLEKIANGTIYAILTLVLMIPIIQFCTSKLKFLIGQSIIKD